MPPRETNHGSGGCLRPTAILRGLPGPPWRNTKNKPSLFSGPSFRRQRPDRWFLSPGLVRLAINGNPSEIHVLADTQAR